MTTKTKPKTAPETAVALPLMDDVRSMGFIPEDRQPINENNTAAYTVKATKPNGKVRTVTSY